MATYLGTHGSKIQNYTTDPDNPNTGEVWFNAADGVLKFNAGPLSDGWATGNSRNNGVNEGGGSGGDQTAGIAFSGSPPSIQQKTELYNGTNWTEVNDMSEARRYAGSCGTQTAALAAGGAYPWSALVESWNGTNWTAVNDLNTARYALNCGGTNTAAIAFGGTYAPSSPPSDYNNTESWNGTNWTNVNDMSRPSQATGGGVGLAQNQVLAFGGYPPSALTESWNGTNWTEVADLNTARGYLGSGGNYTSAIAFGGFDSGGNSDKTETWNGTSWTETSDMLSARQGVNGAGTSNAGGSVFAYGGSPGTNTDVQLWNSLGGNKTISTS